MKPLATILTAMVTPFDQGGALDLGEAQRLANWLVDRGNDGLVIAGSTGEGQTLDAKERVALVRAVKEAVAGRACVVANAGTNDTRASVAAAHEMEAAGADALLATVPWYNKPQQSGMLAHFCAIADATRLPVIVYNIPSRTAANIHPETLLELARRKQNVAGVKESSGDLKQIGMIIRDRDQNFAVWSGDDHLFLPTLAIGGDGIVGVASHLCSPEYRRIFEAFCGGRTEEAARAYGSLLPLIDALFAASSPIPIKWAVRELGFHVGSCRLPLDEIPPALAERLRPLIAPYLTAV